MYVSYLTDIGNLLPVFTWSNDSRIGGYKVGANAPPPTQYFFLFKGSLFLPTEFKIDK